jgi:hypothetical protein
MIQRNPDNSFCFESYGVTIGIESNSAALLKQAGMTATHALLDEIVPIACDSAQHWFRITDDGGACSIYQDESRIVTDAVSHKFWKFFDSLVRIKVAEHAKSVVFVHAGVVGWRGRAIVIPGNSFQGKTTLVAELVKCGADYYSDEYAVFDKDGLVHPFARRLSLRNSEGTITETPTTAEELGGRTGTSPLTVGTLLFTTYKPGAKWDPEMLSAGTAVVEMIAQTIPIRANPEFAIRVLNKVATGAIIAKGERDDASNFAGYFLDFVDNTTI